MFYVIKSRRGDGRYYLVAKAPDEVSANMTAHMLNMGNTTWWYHVVAAEHAVLK